MKPVFGTSSCADKESFHKAVWVAAGETRNYPHQEDFFIAEMRLLHKIDYNILLS